MPKYVLIYKNGKYIPVDRENDKEKMLKGYNGPVYPLPLYNQREGQNKHNAAQGKKIQLFVSPGTDLANIITYYNTKEQDLKLTITPLSQLENKPFDQDTGFDGYIIAVSSEQELRKVMYSMEMHKAPKESHLSLQAERQSKAVLQLKKSEKSKKQIPSKPVTVVYTGEPPKWDNYRSDGTAALVDDIEKYSFHVALPFDFQKGIKNFVYKAILKQEIPSATIIPPQYIDRLESYITKRGNDNRELYHGFLSLLFGGHTRQTKRDAAGILVEVLQGIKTPDFLKPYEKALNQGELGKIYSDIVDNKYIEPYDAKKYEQPESKSIQIIP